MSIPTTPDSLIVTAGGTLPLVDYRLRSGDQEWTIWHTGTVLTKAAETHAIVLKTNRVPYGVALWPGAIALGARDRRRLG